MNLKIFYTLMLISSAVSCSSEEDTKKEAVNEDYSKFYVRSPQDASAMIDFDPLLVGSVSTI